MIMSAFALLRRIPHPNEEEMREGLAGNLCRCTGYSKILESVARACQDIARAR
jgi:aerobic-type carbon monoxide dehydrogenase small subunit (CoxS/CutS family)